MNFYKLSCKNRMLILNRGRHFGAMVKVAPNDAFARRCQEIFNRCAENLNLIRKAPNSRVKAEKLFNKTFSLLKQAGENTNV